MSDKNTVIRKGRRKILYVFRVINLKSLTKQEEITSESFVIVESTPLRDNSSQLHRWRSFTGPPSGNRSRHSSSVQGNAKKEMNKDGNREEVERKATELTSEDLHFLYDEITKPTDFHFTANEKTGSFLT